MENRETESYRNLPASTSAKRASRKFVRSTLPAVYRVNELSDRAAEFINHAKYEQFGLKDNIARSPIILGLIVLALFFGLFGSWALLAPLDGASIAPGVVVSGSSRKTIQHLEGGIIDKILVTEGQEVKAGQEIIRLSATAAKAKLDLVTKQFIGYKAAEARLMAERDGKDSFEFPKEVLEQTARPEVKDIMDTQNKLFEARKSTYFGQVSVLKQRIAQLDDQIRGLRAQEKAAGGQLKLVNDEARIVEELLKQGNANKPRLLSLQRRAQELQGSKGEITANISKAQQAIGETEQQILNVKSDRIKQVVDELKETQARISDSEENMRASSDVFRRISITSPIDGYITGLKFHTTGGGVIQPGAPITDIVPKDDNMVIEAQVMPQDIDVVHSGLKARVKLTAYKSNVPMVDGKVVNVSADSFKDDRTGRSYYTARVEVPKENFQKYKITLQPGMQAEVFIVTGERTLASYLLTPITNSMDRAFKD